MGKRRNGLLVLAMIAVLALVAAACSDDGGGETGSTTGASGATALSGTITISGSSTVQPITSLVAELFNEDVSSDVSITVDGPGTGDGFVLFCDGETDISDASRPIEDEEATACQKNGIEYVELAIAFDGITVMTNPANTEVTCLDDGDLYGLFGPESDGIDTWDGANQLAQQVGGKGGLPSLPLDITAPGTESGTYDAFIELAGIEDNALAQGVPEDKAASLRTDYHSSPDDNVIITAMEGSDSPLGFVGFAYAEGAGDQVKILQVDGGDGCVAPDRDTIADASYPLSRTLYFYVNKAKISDPAIKAFVDYYLSDSGVVDAVQQTGYVELPEDQIAATRSTWDAAASGASGSTGATGSS
ncbi:MAG TPA: phosphate ABC transporter substrate-binding protein PstS family protein [Actinomycetota bacterium]|nr:phosphate ABC transporter substrate-binding protein PstS family protein [Actinomycetota bacterium]